MRGPCVIFKADSEHFVVGATLLSFFIQFVFGEFLVNVKLGYKGEQKGYDMQQRSSQTQTRDTAVTLHVL